jgi:hypothetical protein
MSRQKSKWFDLIITKEEGLSVLLFVLVLLIFVIYPLQTMGITSLLLARIFLSIMVIAGVWSVGQNKTRLVIFIIAAIANLVFQWYRAISDVDWVHLASLGITISFEALLIYFILLRTTAPGPVNSYRIQGSVVVYLLIGVLFSSIYALIYILNRNSFNFTNPPETIELSQASLTYFSFVTLTTIGYGDIQPLHPFAQATATMEGLIGQLFPAILIGRLVSQSLTSSIDHIDGRN